MPKFTFTSQPGSLLWQDWDMESYRQSFSEIIFESFTETTLPTLFRLNFGDSTADFTGTGLEYSFDATGDVSAITAGTLTGMAVTLASGPRVIEATGLSVPAMAYAEALAAEDSAALFNLLIAGNDRILGGGGDDRLVGHLGRDTISGGAGNDWIAGEAGADQLFGGRGRDSLDGGTGSDRLIGGADRDWLTGGSGRDSFVFLALSETAATSVEADVITDFRRGEDRIDLRGIDAFAGSAADDAFLWIGTANFSNATAGELRYRKVDQAGTANDHTLVFLDVDGDRAAEAVIRLNGLHDLTAADFLL